MNTNRHKIRVSQAARVIMVTKYPLNI